MQESSCVRLEQEVLIVNRGKMNMKNYLINNKKLLAIIIHFVAVLGIEVCLLLLHATMAVYSMLAVICGALCLYNEIRWVTGYRSINDVYWRSLPFILKNQPDLNAYCLNFYKWLLTTATIPILLFL